MAVDLIVPLKPPRMGKSRLRGALGCPTDERRHAELVLALASDTLHAATAAPGVRRVLVIGADPAALATLRELGVDTVSEDIARAGRTGRAAAGQATEGHETPDTGQGLNAALRAGERLLRSADPAAVVGALQADLPALRADELAAALTEADARRAFTADRHGTGTTLLLSGPGQPLDPRFGPGSARAHTESGAVPLRLPAPSLRGDVDTPSDLEQARLLGLGEHTVAVLDRACLPR